MSEQNCTTQSNNSNNKNKMICTINILWSFPILAIRQRYYKTKIKKIKKQLSYINSNNIII